MGIPQGWRTRKQRYLLMGGICLNCGHKLFPPRAVCPECGASAGAPSAVAGRREVFSYVLFCRVPVPASLTR
jgi:scaffold protein (connect acetoacetyl-CoA thiolase and HMG-CoA synthase)